jgi:hypothetical protein
MNFVKGMILIIFLGISMNLSDEISKLIIYRKLKSNKNPHIRVIRLMKFLFSGKKVHYGDRLKFGMKISTVYFANDNIVSKSLDFPIFGLDNIEFLVYPFSMGGFLFAKKISLMPVSTFDKEEVDEYKIILFSFNLPRNKNNCTAKEYLKIFDPITLIDKLVENFTSLILKNENTPIYKMYKLTK